MKKLILHIMICAAVMLAAAVIGLVLFLPHTETIHIEHTFVKTNNELLSNNEGTVENTKLDVICDITVTTNNAGLCSASGTIKIDEQTIDIGSASKSPDGYIFNESNSGITSSQLFWHRNDITNTSLTIYSGNYIGSWWYSE